MGCKVSITLKAVVEEGCFSTLSHQGLNPFSFNSVTLEVRASLLKGYSLQIKQNDWHSLLVPSNPAS